MPTKSSLLIDASIYVFQYYFSLPDRWYSEQDAWPTAAVYGYTTFLLRLLQAQKPKRVAACFDKSLKTCFRNDIYPNYKSSRALPDESLAFQLDACQEVTQLLGIKTYGSDTYEADDLLGSLYKRLLRSTMPIAILTRDKDLGQLIQREQDYLWDYANDRCYTRQGIYEKFGVWPHQLSDYLALVGDVSDDIPGVPGLGAKTAQHLLDYYGSIEHLWGNLDQLTHLPIRGAKSLGEKLLHHKDQIVIAQQLATIVQDVPLIQSVSELQWQVPQWQVLEVFCHSMGFPGLLGRVQALKSKY